mgnify:CR=1 FL=1
MDTNNWIQLITAILAGLATAIPLVVQLVNVVKKATKEKNWNQLMKMAMDYMGQAEKNISSGAERKEWVLSMIKVSAVNINYDLTDEDIEKLSDLIDAICDASKVINNNEEKAQALKEAKEKIKELEAQK